MEPIDLPPRPEPHPLFDPISLALVAEIARKGYANVTVPDIAREAGTSLGEFHDRYADVEDCAVDTYERLIVAFECRVGEAFNRHSDWRSALRAAAYEAADILAAFPQMPRFGMNDVLRIPNEMVMVRREELFAFCAQMIDRGRTAAPNPEAIPEEMPIVAIGSIIQLLTHRLQEGVEIDFHASARESIYGVVRAYLGEEAAREELAMARPTPVGAFP